VFRRRSQGSIYEVCFRYMIFVKRTEFYCGRDNLCYTRSKASEHQSEPRLPFLIEAHLDSCCSKLCREEGPD